MKHRLSAAVLVAGSLFSAAASAEVTVDARYGLFGWGDGAGLEVAFSATPNSSIRLGFSDTSNKHDKTYSDVNYSIDYKLRTVGLFFDWRPTNGIFFLTGGLMYNNKNSLEGTASGQVSVNDNTSYTDVAVKAEITWDRKTVPYFGVGWGNVGNQNKGLAWSANLGVAFVGDLNAKLTQTGGTQTISNSDLGSEERQIEDDLSFMRRLPMAHFGLGYTF